MPPATTSSAAPDGASDSLASQSAAVPLPPLRAGQYTSEFWLMILLIVLDAAGAIAGTISGTTAATAGSIIGIAYTGVRSLLKMVHAQAHANVLAEQAAYSDALPTGEILHTTQQPEAPKPTPVVNGRGGYVGPELVAVIALLSLFAIGLSACASGAQPRLPRGSYAEVSGYAKDSGGRAAVGGQILAHIPLDGGFAK